MKKTIVWGDKLHSISHLRQRNRSRAYKLSSRMCNHLICGNTCVAGSKYCKTHLLNHQPLIEELDDKD